MLTEEQADFQPKRADCFGPALEPLTVRIPVAIRLTGIGRSKLYELIKTGELKTVKIGSSTLITMASLRRLVEHGSA
jgi:excisionase family DNA binding protein